MAETPTEPRRMAAVLPLFWLPIPLAAVCYLSLQTGILRHRRNSGVPEAN